MLLPNISMNRASINYKEYKAIIWFLWYKGVVVNVKGARENS